MGDLVAVDGAGDAGGDGRADGDGAGRVRRQEAGEDGGRRQRHRPLLPRTRKRLLRPREAAAEAPQRQRQLKQLAGKFTGHEFWDPNNSRYELRRLERPLHTYRDEENGILDGALYTLANGTNPEVMLFVEARVNPKEKTKSAWQFAVGRSSHAEWHLLYDDKEVLESPRGDRLSGWDKPYWLGTLSADPKPDPKK